MARMVGVTKGIYKYLLRGFLKGLVISFIGTSWSLKMTISKKTALSMEISQESLIVGAKLLSLRRKESSSDSVPLQIKKDIVYISLVKK